MASTKQWMRFFLGAGIPPDSAAHYAVSFEQNRMGLDMLLELDKEYLRDLKITALGDIISILRHARKHHAKTEREAALARQEGGGEDTPPSPAPPPAKRRAVSPEEGRDEGRAARIREELERTARVEQELLRARSSKTSTSSSKSSTSSSKTSTSRERAPTSPVVTRKEVKEEVVVKQVVSKEVETKSVFSRLGGTEVEKEKGGVKQEVKVEVKQEGRGIFGRLGRQEEGEAKVKDEVRVREQEARVTSTSEEPRDRARASASPGRGILKKRAAGEVGSAMVRSKSASNIISLKAVVKEKHGKRISFGETETRTMASRADQQDLRSRLGYGRQASPPPPEVEDGGGMTTEIRKIAVGGGRFEMRKMMKMVKSELGRESRERELAAAAPVVERKEVKEEVKVAKVAKVREEVKVGRVREEMPGRLSSAGVFASESAAAKLQVSVTNKQAKPLVREERKRVGEEEAMERPSRKRLAKYTTLADGSQVKEYISYDDPILATVPIQKKEQAKVAQVAISKDKSASNFQVVRRPTLHLHSEQPATTLAEKARLMRSRAVEVEEEEGRSRKEEGRFETLASRAQRRRSASPPVRERSPVRSREGRPSLPLLPPSLPPAPPAARAGGGKVFDRLGPKY